MGAESCEKSESLQSFFATFLMYALCGSKKLRKKFGNFHFRQQIARSGAKVLRCKCGRRKLHGGNNTGSGSAKNMNCSRGSTHTVCSTQSRARAPHDAHHTKYGHGDRSIDNQSEEVAVAAAAAAASQKRLLWQQQLQQPVRRGCCGSSSCSSE